MTPLLTAEAVQNGLRLQSTDLRLGEGELVALIGPNGSGKTSLLRALADVEGQVLKLEIGGEDFRSIARGRRPHLLTFLPASRDIVWPIAVRDVVALGSSGVTAARIAEVLRLLELDLLADRPVNSLSTGERSRVLLARALAPAPKLLLLDEPLSNMDPSWALRTIELLRAATDHSRCSALVALHDLHQLEKFDRILVMDAGRLVLDDAPSEVIESSIFAETFRIEWRSGRWEIRRPADPQSSR